VITILFVHHNDDFEIDLFRIVATSSFENIKIKGLLKAMKKLITTTKKLCKFVLDEIICNVIKEEFKLIMDFLKNRYINIWDNDASLTLINEKLNKCKSEEKNMIYLLIREILKDNGFEDDGIF